LSRRHAGRLILGLILIVGFSVVASTLATTSVAPRAAADPLADKRAEAAQLVQRIQQLGQQEDALSEQYDQATITLAAAQQRVDQATQQLASDQRALATARSSLTNEAVNAYVSGGDQTAEAASDALPLGSINQSLVRDEYLGDLTSTQTDVIDQYHLATLKTSDDRNQLKVALGAAQDQQAALAQDRQAVQASAVAVQNTLNSVNGQIATLVAQIQLQQQQAAAAAARQRLAAQQAAAAQAAAAQQALAAQQANSGLAVTTANSGSSSGGGSTGSTSATPVVATGSLQARAIAFAESRLGDPYVWGAAGPSTFDCSGLVMWSYAQAGYSLPHYSGSQYADTIHIPLADVQPGDLVFPADPGEHVAMYIGGGNIIEAPYTGADVHIVPLGGWFVYASRVP